MYGCESWTVKKADRRRIGAFELWCWGRLLKVPWTARRSSQSILKDQSWIFIGRTDAKAETLILWPPDVKSWLIGTDPEAGKDWRWEKGMTGWGGWMASSTQWIWLSWLQELMMDREAWRAACCLWGCKGSDMTAWQNWTEQKGSWSLPVSIGPKLLRIRRSKYL